MSQIPHLQKLDIFFKENGEFAIGWPGMEFGVSLKATIMGNTHELESQSLNLRGMND